MELPASNGHAVASEPLSYSYSQNSWGSMAESAMAPPKLIDAAASGSVNLASPVPSAPYSEGTGGLSAMDGHGQLGHHACSAEQQQQHHHPHDNQAQQHMSMPHLQSSVAQGFQTGSSIDSVFADGRPGSGMHDDPAHSQALYPSDYLMNPGQDRTTSDVLQMLVSAGSDQLPSPASMSIAMGMQPATSNGVQQADLMSSSIAMALAGVENGQPTQMGDGSQGMRAQPGMMASHGGPGPQMAVLSNHSMVHGLSMAPEGAGQVQPINHNAPSQDQTSYMSDGAPQRQQPLASMAPTQASPYMQQDMSQAGMQTVSAPQQMHHQSTVSPQMQHQQAAQMQQQVAQMQQAAQMQQHQQQQAAQMQQHQAAQMQQHQAAAAAAHQNQLFQAQAAHVQAQSQLAACQVSGPPLHAQQQQQQQFPHTVQVAPQNMQMAGQMVTSQQGNMSSSVQQQQVAMQVAVAQQQQQDVATARAQQEAVCAQAQIQAQAHQVAAQTAQSVSMQHAHHVAAQQAHAQAQHAANSVQQLAAAESQVTATLNLLATSSPSMVSLEGQQHSMQAMNPMASGQGTPATPAHTHGTPMADSFSGSSMPQQHGSLAANPSVNSLQQAGQSLPPSMQTMIAPQQAASQSNQAMMHQPMSGALPHVDSSAAAQMQQHDQQMQSSQQNEFATQHPAMPPMQGIAPDRQHGAADQQMAAGASLQQVVHSNSAARPPLPPAALAQAAVVAQQHMMAAAAQQQATGGALGLQGTIAVPPVAPSTTSMPSVGVIGAEGVQPSALPMGPALAAMVNAAAAGAGICLVTPTAYRGVQWDPVVGAWQAVFAEGDVPKSLGHFKTEQEAAIAWDQEARIAFGPNPQHLNFPQQGSLQDSQGMEGHSGSRPGSPKAEPYRSSKFRGVSRGRGKKKWRAMIQHQKKQIHVGYYDSGNEAARAYDREAVRLLGADAVTNFPLSDYYPELTDAGKQGMPGESRPAGDDNEYEYDEYDDDDEEGTGSDAGKGGDTAEGGQAGGQDGAQAVGTPAATPPAAQTPTPDASEGKANGLVTPTDTREPSPQMMGMEGAAPMAANMSEGTPCSSIPAGPISMGPVPDEQKSVEQLLRDSGRSELWGVKQEGGSWRAKITIDLGLYPSPGEAAAAHDRAATWTLGVTANTNLAKGNKLVTLSGGARPSVEPTGSQAETPDGGQVAATGEPAQKRAKVSKYHGVVSRDAGESWYAAVKCLGDRKEFGPFKSEKDAARHYDRCSALLWGLQARTNFPLIDALCTMPEAPALVEQVVQSYNANRDKQAEAADMARAGSLSQPFISSPQVPHPLDTAPSDTIPSQAGQPPDSPHVMTEAFHQE
eukprot:CAMPEP_0117665736 /NCGR_PEP_ID=MMETSP0804-20121206/9980_1 /TAXON_ID=1074897 /ORGANISM="Tetraselmis astigmatica, Strain CCMP880" /LENGTH=1337 /DNA_ID=CAMNT_0005473191 /DNA_START=336 /DNA_END=4349 /DNA_ORIENTATION=+